MLGTTNAIGNQILLNNKNLTISLNGSSSIVYDGSTTKSINITPASIGAAAASHTHSNIISSGRATALTGSETISLNGISMAQVYNNGYPISYGNIIRICGGGSGELLCGWAGISGAYAGLYYRSQRDSGPIWSNWSTILDSDNYTNWAAQVSHTHTKSQITNFPDSLPANGGNSDTVDGLHAAAFAYKINYAPGDINSAIESGFYRLSSSHLNSPGAWGQMIVCSGGGDTIGQLYFDYGSTIIKFRAGNPPILGGVGVYTPWTEVLDRSRFNPTEIQPGAPVSDALWAW